MVNEYEALLGLFIVIVLIYFFLWRRSKIIGGFAILFASLSMLVPFGGTDYEMIAWISIIVSLTALISEYAFAKMGATRS